MSKFSMSFVKERVGLKLRIDNTQKSVCILNRIEIIKIKHIFATRIFWNPFEFVRNFLLRFLFCDFFAQFFFIHIIRNTNTNSIKYFLKILTNNNNKKVFKMYVSQNANEWNGIQSKHFFLQWIYYCWMQAISHKNLSYTSQNASTSPIP